MTSAWKKELVQSHPNLSIASHVLISRRMCWSRWRYYLIDEMNCQVVKLLNSCVASFSQRSGLIRLSSVRVLQASNTSMLSWKCAVKRGKFGSYLSFLEENFDMPTKSFSYINISTAIDKIENAIFLVLNGNWTARTMPQHVPILWRRVLDGAACLVSR